MAKEEHSNQLNLTVVALVALVAIVGLVALVMNAASITPRIATGSQVASAADEANVAGNAVRRGTICNELRKSPDGLMSQWYADNC